MAASPTNPTALCLALLFLAAGCAGTGSAPAGGPFPTPGEVDRLAASEPPLDPVSHDGIVDVDRWTLVGPFPDRIGEVPIEAATVWDEVLLDAMGGRAGLVVASESMRCAARELAAFILENEGLPPHILRRYMAGRCGATAARQRVGWVSGEAFVDQTEAELLDAWRPQIEEMIRSNHGTGPESVGIAAVRRDSRVVVAFVSARRRSLIEPIPFLPDAGVVRLEGELLSHGEEVFGEVTHGELGFGVCEFDESVRLPRFKASCPVVPDDDTAVIEIASRAAGRFLAYHVLEVRVTPSGDEAREWESRRYGAAGDIVDGADLTTRLLAETNRMRARLDLPALVLEERESETARKLAPFYFGSQFGVLETIYGDQAALGLLAGWQVPGTIKKARMASALALATQGMDDFLAEAFDGPSFRRVLLDPDKERVAIGPLVSREHQYVGTLVSAYSLYGQEDYEAQREAFYARIARIYQTSEKQPPRRAVRLETLVQRRADRIMAGAEDTDQALNRMLKEAAAALNAQVRGWVLSADDIDAIQLPEELFRSRSIRMAAAVGHYQPDDWPWGRTFVLLLVAPDSPTRTAMAR